MKNSEPRLALYTRRLREVKRELARGGLMPKREKHLRRLESLMEAAIPLHHEAVRRGVQKELDGIFRSDPKTKKAHR